MFVIDTIINYNNGLFSGQAKIKGIALDSVFGLGKTYILEDLSGNLPNEEYQYNHFVCAEIHIKESPFWSPGGDQS